MSKMLYKIGTILENPLRQFTKVISFSNGRYGLSGWSTKVSAEKSTVAITFVNRFGLQYANVKEVGTSESKVKKVPTSSPSVGPSKKKPTEAELKKLNAKQVKALAEKLGIDNSGNRADVEKRILGL